MSTFVIQVIALLVVNAIYPRNAYFNRLGSSWTRSILRSIIFLLITVISGFIEGDCILSVVSSAFVFFFTLLFDRRSYKNPKAFTLNVGLQIMAVCVVFSVGSDDWSFSEITQWIESYEFDPNALLHLLGFMLCLTPANIFIQSVLDRLKLESPNSNNDEGMQRAGRTIGILERLITLIFILLNQFEAIGLLIAAKSLIRFKESQAKSEYIIIGNLLSFGFAILIGTALRMLAA